MMLRLSVWLAGALLLPAVSASAAAPAPKKFRVAVMEIRALGTEPHKAELLSEVALTEAASGDRVEVIGRSDIAALVGFEQQRRVLGCSDDSACLAEIGGALGVDYVMAGSLGRLGALYRVDLKLVDTRKVRVVGRFGESVESAEEKLVATVQRGVRELLVPLLGKELPPPVAARPPAVGGPAVALPPPAAATRPAADAPAAKAAAPAGAGWSRSAWGWTSAGVGAGVAALGVVFGLQAQSAYQDEKKASAAGDRATYDSAKSKAKSSALIADACYGIGAVGVGVGTYLLLTDRAPPVAVVPTEGGALAVYAGRF